MKLVDVLSYLQTKNVSRHELRKLANKKYRDPLNPIIREKYHDTLMQYKKLLISNNYIDLARAKSEALVNNTCKQKKINRVMLNGDDNENGFKLAKKKQTKKQICTCSTLFCLSLAVVLHDYNAVLHDFVVVFSF